MARPRTYFAGKHVLITGGSEGIGLALARRLVALDAGVTLVARDAGKLAAAATALRGGRVRTLSLDVADAAAVATALPEELAAQPIDVLVNGAGVAHPASFLDAEPETLRRHMDVMYWGAVWMTRAVLPGMVARSSGHVLNIGSTLGVIGVYGYSDYAPPKFALLGFSEVLRSELRGSGVGVTIALPSSTRTAMLEHELQIAPPQTQAVLKSTRVASPDAVAKSLLRAVAKGRFEVMPGLDVALQTRAYRISPRIGRAIVDFEVRRGSGG